MRRFIITLVSATLLTALFPTVSANAAVVTPGDESLIDCVMAHVPEAIAEVRDMDWGDYGDFDLPDYANLPSFTLNQANAGFLQEYLDAQAEAALAGEFLRPLDHDDLRAAFPRSHTLFVSSGGMEGFEDRPAKEEICRSGAYRVISAVGELTRGDTRLASVRPLYVSMALTTIEGEVLEWQNPDTTFTKLMAVHVWTPKAPGTEFLDAPVGHTFLSDINSLAVSGITKGCNPPLNTHFCPDDFVTRAQMATFLVRALGLQHVEPWFEDLSSESAHWLDIGALAAAGITRGCNPPANDRFCADDFLTRGQMATFLVRALDLPAAEHGFTDVTADNAHAADIGALAASGITRGCNPPTNDRFCADDFVTRAQMAAFLVRAGMTD